MGLILFVAYCAAGYWATGWTIYYDKVLIEFQPWAIFARKFTLGLVLGWILIPIAVIRKLMAR